MAERAHNVMKALSLIAANARSMDNRDLAREMGMAINGVGPTLRMIYSVTTAQGFKNADILKVVEEDETGRRISPRRIVAGPRIKEAIKCLSKDAEET